MQRENYFTFTFFQAEDYLTFTFFQAEDRTVTGVCFTNPLAPTASPAQVFKNIFLKKSFVEYDVKIIFKIVNKFIKTREEREAIKGLEEAFQNQGLTSFNHNISDR